MKFRFAAVRRADRDELIPELTTPPAPSQEPLIPRRSGVASAYAASLHDAHRVVVTGAQRVLLSEQIAQARIRLWRFGPSCVTTLDESGGAQHIRRGDLPQGR